MNDKGRIAAPVIAEGLFSYQIGGSERVGADLALEFKRRGFDVICFAFYDSDGPVRRELEEAGIRCLDLNYERCRGVQRRIEYLWKVWRMLWREGVTALHVHHATALILCGIPAMLSPVRKVVMTEHGLHQLKERPKYRRSARRYCRFAHETTAVEPGQADYFVTEMGVPKSRVHYIPNGVRANARTPERVARARLELAVPAGTFAFFYVGRLSPVKDLDTLLRALALLPADLIRTVRTYLVGDGPERPRLEQLTSELQLRDQVTFLGARKNVSELLMAADAFVMSSKTEGLPMALLEAMAAGLPCVATAVGGIPGLLAERGVVVPPGNPEALASAMTLLLREPALRSGCGERARIKVRDDYSLDAVADAYLAVLGLPRSFG